MFGRKKPPARTVELKSKIEPGDSLADVAQAVMAAAISKGLIKNEFFGNEFNLALERLGTVAAQRAALKQANGHDPAVESEAFKSLGYLPCVALATHYAPTNPGPWRETICRMTDALVDKALPPEKHADKIKPAADQSKDKRSR